MELFLKPYGESVSASNGKEALEIHLKSLEEGDPFDVIYLDMVMPDITGIDVLASLRESESQKGKVDGTPVIMLTGETDISHINMAKSFGITEYILKPVEEERVIQGLERLDLIKDS